jgi:hypothetical protein
MTDTREPLETTAEERAGWWRGRADDAGRLTRDFARLEARLAEARGTIARAEQLLHAAPLESPSETFLRGQELWFKRARAFLANTEPACEPSQSAPPTGGGAEWPTSEMVEAGELECADPLDGHPTVDVRAVFLAMCAAAPAPPAAEPVAYRWRTKQAPADLWQFCRGRPNWANSSFVVEPLYLAPPVDRVKRIVSWLRSKTYFIPEREYLDDLANQIERGEPWEPSDDR